MDGNNSIQERSHSLQVAGSDQSNKTEKKFSDIWTFSVRIATVKGVFDTLKNFGIRFTLPVRLFIADTVVGTVDTFCLAVVAGDALGEKMSNKLCSGIRSPGNKVTAFEYFSRWLGGTAAGVAVYGAAPAMGLLKAAKNLYIGKSLKTAQLGTISEARDVGWNRLTQSFDNAFVAVDEYRKIFNEVVNDPNQLRNGGSLTTNSQNESQSEVPVESNSRLSQCKDGVRKLFMPLLGL